MNHLACPNCQLRFTPAQAVAPSACPECGEFPQELPGPQAAMGFRLYEPDPAAHELPEAAAAVMPIPPRL